MTQIPAQPTAATNPLLRHDETPRFDQIDIAQIVPTVRALVARQDRALADLEATLTPTWEGLAQPLSDLGEPLAYAWGAVHHLLSVQNSPALREAEAEVQPEVVEASLRLGQNRKLYDGFVALRDGPGWAKLTPARQRIVQSSIEQAELAGVALVGEAKQRFIEVQTELAEASTKFSNNLLDATKAFSLVLRTSEDMAGLPPSVHAAAAQSARDNAGDDSTLAAATAEKGPWRLTLEASLYVPVLEHSQRRDLRETLYRAYVTRASAGALDNQPLIKKILRLRREEAELLGFTSYAALSLKRKMAKQVTAVTDLLDQLRRASRSHAE